MGSESVVRPRQRAQHLGPERRRPQVLDTALRIAVEDGIAAVTVAAVAERMSVTRPVIYACFADRVELIDALIQREEGYLLDGIVATLPRRRVEADEEVFVEGFRALLETVATRPDTWKLLYGNPDPAVANSFGRGRALAVTRCTRRLRPTLRAWGDRRRRTQAPRPGGTVGLRGRGGRCARSSRATTPGPLRIWGPSSVRPCTGRFATPEVIPAKSMPG